MLYMALIIAGILLGAIAFEDVTSAVTGGFIGWLTAFVFKLKSQLIQQREQIASLAEQLKESTLPIRDASEPPIQDETAASGIETTALSTATPPITHNIATEVPTPEMSSTISEIVENEALTHVLNLDIREDSLPPNIGQTAQKLWLDGHQTDAMRLLYRGGLSRLIHHANMPVTKGATEGEFALWVKANCDADFSQYFQQLTQTWQASAYARSFADDEAFKTLCEQWTLKFDKPLERNQQQAATDLYPVETTITISPSNDESVEPEDKLSALINLVRDKVVGYFTGGNIMMRVGVLILFFGVAFLLKYAADHSMVPIEFRYLGIFAGALVMLIFGWRLRQRHRQYALVLQGGAIGVLYLAIFSAYQLHDLITPVAAFSLLLGMVMLAALVAILQNAIWLAAVGVTGGFLAPILASSGTGSHVGLFSYYLILNLGILFIAFYRSWRLLNWLGFVFTFGIGTLWGARYYSAEYFSTTEPFLIAFFALYTLIPLLYAVKQPPNLKGMVDGTLVFGTPVAFMALQSQLVDDFTAVGNMLPLTSIALGALYIALAWLIRHKKELRLLFESYLAMAIAFLTLAVPLGFDGRVTASVWAIEGAALIWVGLRQSRLLPRCSGLGLMLLSAGFFFNEPNAGSETTFLLNADFMGSLLLSIAAFYAAYLYTLHIESVTAPEKFAALGLLLWGFAWWYGGGIREITLQFTGLPELFALQSFIAATAVSSWLVCQRQKSLPLFALSLLTAFSGLLFLIYKSDFQLADNLWFNLNFASAAMLSALLLWMAVYAWRCNFQKFIDFAKASELILLWSAALLWLGFGYNELQHFLGSGYQLSIYLAYSLLSLAALVPLHNRLKWDDLTQPVLLALPLLTLVVLGYTERNFHLVAYYGWLIFPLAVAAVFASLKYLEKVQVATSDSMRYPLGYLHMAAILIVVFALTWQFSKLFQPTKWQSADLWILAVWGISGSLLLAALRRWKNLSWPIQQFPFELTVLLPRLVLILLAIWVVISNLHQPGDVVVKVVEGVQPGFTYIPLLNPLDLANIAALLLLTLWTNRYDRNFLSIKPVLNYCIPGGLAFFWANAALLRAFHYILDIPYRFEPMFRSFAVESGLSILWSVIGLAIMVIATRKAWRPLWITGGVLMGIVVLKLFVIDMDGTGTIARIIAFITVGGLLLLIGYFAPVPPRKETDPAEDSNTSVDNAEPREASAQSGGAAEAKRQEGGI